MSLISVFLWLFAFITLTSGLMDFTGSNCKSLSNCTSCLLTPHCSWCLDTGYQGTYRCNSEERLLNGGCERNLIFSGKSEFQLIENQDLSESNKVKPQSVKVKLRPGSSYSFEVLYKHLDKYETDVYALSSPVGSLSLQLSYSVNCPGAQSQETVCLRVKRGETAKINVTVTLEKCTEANSRGTYVSIAVAGEPLMLHVQPICKCDCDKHKELSSAKFCNGKGDLICGGCECKKGYSGPNCECSVPPGTTYATLIQHCKQNKNTEVCSGQGQCKCGKCSCAKPQVTGKFCECDNDKCVAGNGRICSGNGNCSCGICQCSTGWSGPTCDCPTSNAECLDDNKVICGGRGKCLCGKCTCERDYMGPTCNQCQSCSSTKSSISAQTESKVDIFLRKPEKKSSGQNVSTPSEKSAVSRADRLSISLVLVALIIATRLC